MTIHTATFEGIGVTNQVTVSEPAALIHAARIARDEVAALDLACSRFRADSELVGLNRSAGKPSRVSLLLLEAVETALYAAVITDGLVDPTVGGAMRAIGYDRDFLVVIAQGGAPSFALVPAGGWQDIIVDHDERLVTVPSGYELDLGATAKALAADRIATSVRALTGSDVLVSLGGDISVQGAPEGGWPIFVTDSHRDAHAEGQTVSVHAGGLATSSTTVRRWTAAGIERHHVVDPATGAPTIGPWRTISVAAKTCVAANAASTASIVLGASAPAWLAARGLPARMIANDGTVEVSGDWPPHSQAFHPPPEDSQQLRNALQYTADEMAT